jgi:hypothetical protein
MACFGRRVATFLALVALARPASAQSDEEREQARTLMDRGDELAEEKKHIEALDAYQQAHTIMRVPTTGIEVVRMLLSLGRLIEARQVSAEIMALPIQPDEPGQFSEARTEAERLASELDARVPRLTVKLASGSKLHVDGTEKPEVHAGEPFAIDPGTHVLEARGGPKSVTKSIRIEERERRVVDLTPPKPERAAPRPARTVVRPRTQPRETPNTTRVLGWTGIGIGGAGIVFGAITAGLALNERAQLDDAGCVDGSCPAGRADDVDHYNRMRTFSSVGLIGGAVFATAGAVLLGFGDSTPARTGRTAWPKAARFDF